VTAQGFAFGRDASLSDASQAGATSMAGVFELPVLDPLDVPPVPAYAPAAAAAQVPAGPSPEDLVAQAHAEAEAIRAQAREDGFAAGLQAAQAELQSASEALASALNSVAELRGQVADEVERGAVALGLRIAEQALSGAVEADPDRVVDAVRGALRCLTERSRVTILVNPEDMDAVRAATSDLIARLGGIETCDVQAERRVSRGGAVVRTFEGEVDATLETKLARARDVIADGFAVGRDASLGDTSQAGGTAR
jgi:flagellar assembly protein FliH